MNKEKRIIFEQLKDIKDIFTKLLKVNLNLISIPSPLFLNKNDYLNDMLNNVENAVDFNIPEISVDAEIIHSLAKWKRVALKRYDFNIGEGIVCDMIAIRKHEKPDNIHSILVDQWDWEKIIDEKNRNINTLKQNANIIYSCLKQTQEYINKKYNLTFNTNLPEELFFITSQELEDLFPNLSPKEREKEITKKYQAVFIIGIGHQLNSGIKHDNRSAEYDDWNLNGDLLLWNEKLNDSIELSSMGVRVNSKSLIDQLKIQNSNNESYTDYQQDIIKNVLPLTIGGGIGHSRVCMFILQKKHIGEVQVSLWDDETYKNSEILK